MVPNLRFPNHNENWVKTQISELGAMGRGKSKHRPRDDEKLFGGKYPFIQTGDIKNSNLCISSYEKTYSDFGLLQSKLWRKGTLCITIAANIAETAILGFDACFPDSVIGWESNNSTSNYFMKYYFDFYRDNLKRLSVGGAQENLNLDKLKSLSFNIPLKEEQDKITKFLIAIDKRIETQFKIINDYKSLIKEIGDVEFAKYNSFTKLANVCTISKGIQINGNELLPEGKYYMMNGGIEPSGYINSYNTNENTISISEGGNSCGYVQFNFQKFWSGGHCYTLQNINSNYDNLFLYFYLKNQEKKIMKLRIGTGLPNIQKKDLENFPVPIISIKEQHRIKIIFDSISYKIKLEEKVLNNILELKKYLLNNLFV